MTIKIKKSMMWRKAILGFKFTLHNVEGQKGLGKYKWMKKLTLNALWIMFHGLKNLLLGPPCQVHFLTTSLLYHELKKSLMVRFWCSALRFFYNLFLEVGLDIC
jgi:hypothetical protein